MRSSNLTPAQRGFFTVSRVLGCRVYHDAPRHTAKRNESRISRVKSPDREIISNLTTAAINLFGEKNVRVYNQKNFPAIRCISIRRDR